MKFSVCSFLLLALTAEAADSRDLQMGGPGQMEESDFPSFVPTVSPAPTLMEAESDPPSDMPTAGDASSEPSDVPSMPPGMIGVPTPVSETLTTPPVVVGSTPAPTTPKTLPPVPTSSSSIVSSCVGLVLAAVGLGL